MQKVSVIKVGYAYLFLPYCKKKRMQNFIRFNLNSKTNCLFVLWFSTN